MTAEQIKEVGKLVDVENPLYVPIYREYWQIHNMVYIINEENEVEDFYEIA